MRTVLTVTVTFLLLTLRTAGQASLPRTVDGHPDLQGTYDIASMTPLERAPGTPLVMTKEEAARSFADRLRERVGTAAA